jgi:hypothetical protein
MAGVRLGSLTAIARVICLALAVALPGLARAEEYPYTYRSAYFLGRGDTGIATADNEDAIFYNPAGIALGKGIYKKIIFASPMIEFSKDTRDVVRQIAIEGDSPTSILREHEGRPQHIGVNEFTGIMFRRVALGAFVNNSTTMMLYKSPTDGAMESVQVGSTVNAGATFTLAQDFFQQTLLVGLTGKGIQKGQAGVDANASSAETLSSVNPDQLAMTGQGFGGDLGIMYRAGGRAGLSLGLTVQDIGNTTFTPSIATELPPDERPLKDNLQTVNAGIAVEPGTRMSRFRILMDYRDLANAYEMSPYKRFHLGGELTVRDFVGFCAGINQGYPTFGFYTDIRVLRLDGGVYTEELAESAGRRPDTRYYMRILVGL